MEQINLKVLLEKGENRRVKIRSCFNSETVKTISAFADSSGGSIIIDSGNCPDDIDISEKVREWIDEISQRTEPSLFVDFITDKIGLKTYILLSADEISSTPVSFDGDYYCRRGDSDIKMNLNEIINLFDK